jgi:hypothetical protein
MNCGWHEQNEPLARNRNGGEERRTKQIRGNRGSLWIVKLESSMEADDERPL